MTKKEFWTRFGLFTLFACIVPFGFIAWRFDLFTKVSKISVGGWGILAIIIAFVFVIYVLKMLKKGMPYSMTTQCINGMLKVVAPLLCLLFVLLAIRTNIDLFIQALYIVIGSEIVAVPLNPFPKWQNENENAKITDMLSVKKALENKEK